MRGWRRTTPLHRTADAAGEGKQRVCRAWHRTGEVKVLLPGVRRAEGQEKGKGVTATWGLEEAQSEAAGRRTGTRYEVWHIRDERARDREVLRLRSGCAL